MACSFTNGMPNPRMARRAIGRIIVIRSNQAHGALMAVQTTRIHDITVKLRYGDDLFISIEGESETVIKAIYPLNVVFLKNILMPPVTIIAGGYTCMGRMPPCVKLVIHHMTIRA